MRAILQSGEGIHFPTATVTGILEDTTYRATEIAPWLSTGLAVVFGLVCIVIAVGDRGLRSSATLLAGAGAAVVGWLVFANPGHLATAGDVFSRQYKSIAACASAGAAAVGLGIAAAARFRLTAAARTVVSVRLVILTTTAGVILLAAATGNRLALGTPNQSLPVIKKVGHWRGHAGFAQPLDAALAAPHWEWRGLFNLDRVFVPNVVPDPEAKLLGWSCDSCTSTLKPQVPGEHAVTVGGRAGRIAFEQALTFTAIEESGNPLWPLRVGERHVFGLAHHARGVEGGWAVAMTAGMKHLTPKHGSITVDDANMSVSVVRTEMHEGFRHFVLEVRDAGTVRALLVMAEGGETWLVPEGGRKRVPFVSTHRKEEGSARFSCHFADEASLPFDTCASGIEPSIPVRGPVSGIKSTDRSVGEDVGAIAAAIVSLGAVVAGNGAYEEYCYQSATPGTGETMPVAKDSSEESERPYVPALVACPPR